MQNDSIIQKYERSIEQLKYKQIDKKRESERHESRVRELQQEGMRIQEELTRIAHEIADLETKKGQRMQELQAEEAREAREKK